jgi:hypothetical protein
MLNSVAEFFIIGERSVVITRELPADEVLSKLSTMNDKPSFVQVPLVITKQLVIPKQLYGTYTVFSLMLNLGPIFMPQIVIFLVGVLIRV